MTLEKEQRSLSQLISDGVKVVTDTITTAFTDPKKLTLETNQKIMIPTAQKVVTTVKNIGSGVVEISGILWPILWISLGIIFILVLLRKYKL